MGMTSHGHIAVGRETLSIVAPAATDLGLYAKRGFVREDG
jgi:hypothetical protein